METVKIALGSNGSSILSTADNYGTTPIHYATLEPYLLTTIVEHAEEVLLNITDSMGNTPLHHSIKYECIESVTILVRAPGCDVNLANFKGETPLIAACKYNNSPIVQLLVATERCDLNASNNEGNTALHISVSGGGQFEMVQCLLQSDRCDPNVFNISGYTPLHIVCHRGDIPLLEALVADKRCDLNIQDDNDDTALHIGVENAEIVSCLLESGRTRCNIYNVKGLTPFHKAIAKGVMASVKLMMKNRLNILQTSNDKFQNAPIHIACIYSRLDILEFLLGYTNCDPNQQNAEGNTALHIVCRMRISSVLGFLGVLTSTPGINLTLVNHEGIAPLDVVVSDHKTLLHYACFEGNSTLAELLVRNGADVMKPNTYGDAPIHIACKRSRLEVLKALFTSNNCNPDQLNADEDTALHIVSRNRSANGLVISKMVEILVKNGADVLKPDRDGDAPIHTLCMYSEASTLKVLVSCLNCDPNQQNAEGDTALHIVCGTRTGSELEYLEVLTSMPGINPTLVNKNNIAPCDVVGSDCNTLFHIACAEGNNTVVELLLKNGADILKSNRNGDAPIHIACKNNKLDILKILLGCQGCDPNHQNAEGNTALHIVCGMGTSKKQQFLEVLISTPGINLTLVNKDDIAPGDVVDSDGNTLLHIACAEGYTAVVGLLMKNGADVLKHNGHGDAPIHIVCKNNKLDILKVLLGWSDCDPNHQNAHGDTALHIVCRMIASGERQLFETLISTPGINPEIVNHEGRTPIDVAINYYAIETINNFLRYKESSIQAYLKIFVVGNSGNGKSTLIKAVTTEASQLLKYTPLSKMKSSDVPPHTAGIVPIPFNSKHFGNAVLYDFAGQHEYYSSHAAVMENLILPSPPLFLLLIDISKSKEVIREELVYWWHFINNQSQKSAAPPHVILAGSHKDMVKSREIEGLEVMIRDCIKRIPVTFQFAGYFPLDCRKLVSQGLSALLNKLNTTCQTLRGLVNVNLHCHILNTLLRTPEFQDLVYCKLVDIVYKTKSDDSLLPKNLSQLVQLLANLNDQGYILLLQNLTDESNSWVILKPDVLLTEVNGSVFAPKYFKEHSEFAMSTGVVTLSKLKERFIEYNHEVIVEYMIHLEFCFRIKDQHTLDMITNNQIYVSASTEEYYFFPALVRVENPIDVCQPHQSIGYECGWLYTCSQETEQLTTRFLHVLILRLAFACKPPVDPASVVLLRSCSVWKHGIAWWTNDGIEVIVEVGLQCRWVAVMMRCPNVKKVECSELRSKVISTVLKAKTDFCPAIAMKEYLIAPSSLKYPFQGRELTLYSMKEVAEATIEGKDFARDSEGKNPIDIQQLLPFEPYYNMENMIPKFFIGDTSLTITAKELTQLAENCHDKIAELKTAFKPDISSFQKDCIRASCTDVERCVALFHILQRRGRFKTWRDFRQEFSRFSIFREENPLVRMRALM